VSGDGYENYEHKRDEQLAHFRLVGESCQAEHGDSEPTTFIAGPDYFYSWDNEEDRPVMRAALGRFAPDGPVFNGDR
jgi:hypothetical protein